MNASEIVLRIREVPDPEVVGGTAYGIRVVLALAFGVVGWSEFRGRTVATHAWSIWTLLASGATLLAAAYLNARALPLGYNNPLSTLPPTSIPPITTLSRLADTLASLSTLTAKLYLASTLYPSASSASRQLLQVGALLTSLSAVPVVVLGGVPVEGLYCEGDGRGKGCFPLESWVVLTRVVAGFSTCMDLALVGIALRMARKRPFDPRERPVEALAIALGAAAFIVGLVKLTKFGALSTGDFTLHGGQILLWTTAESALLILSGATMAPYTAHERIKRPRSPPTDDDPLDGAGAGRVFGGLGCEESGAGTPGRSEVLYRSMVRAGLL